MDVPTSDEDDPGGPDFDAELDRIIREDRELLDRLARSGNVVDAEKANSPVEGDDPGGPDFDADLDEVLRKNAELYRRLTT